MRTILVQGASTAAGWYDMEKAGWPNRVASEVLPLNENNPQEAILVQNESIPGTTLPAILRDISRIDRYQRLGRVTSVLAIGLNESKIRKDRSRPDVSLERFETDLETYSDYMQSRGVNTVYLGTELLLKETIVTEMGNTFESDLTLEYDELLRQQAAKNDMPYISVNGLLGEIGLHRSVSHDGYHPNALGHAAISVAVLDAIKNLGDIIPMGAPEGLHPDRV